MNSTPVIRAARRADASEMVALIDCAGHGMPLWVWQGMKSDESSVLEVGRKRAMREEGGFSYRNAHIIEGDGSVMGMLIGYPIDDPYDMGNLEETPEAFRPLVELEAQVPGSWYVNVVAVHAEHRSRGLGSRLLATPNTLPGKPATEPCPLSSKAATSRPTASTSAWATAKPPGVRVLHFLAMPPIRKNGY